MESNETQGEWTTEEAPNLGAGVETEASENSDAESKGRSDEEAPWASDAPDREADESGEDDEDEDEDELDGFSVRVRKQKGKRNVVTGHYVKKQVIGREDEPVIGRLGRRT